MKKFGIMLLVSLMIVGCSNEKGNESVQDGVSNVVEDSTNQEIVDNQEIININLGESVVIDGIMQFQLEKTEWVDKILPSDTSGVYSYMDDVDGETFFLIKGKLKNLSSVQFDPTYVQESLIKINDQYEFSVTWECEGTDHSDFYGSPKPLQELDLIVYASVSDEVKDIYKDATLTMNVLNDATNLEYFYSNDYQHNTYVLKFSK